MRVAPTCSEPVSQPHIVLPPKKAFNMVGSRPSSMRSREDLEESGAYERPKFVPKPIRKLQPRQFFIEITWSGLVAKRSSI